MDFDVEMINKVKFDGVPDEAIADLEIPSYENILKLLLHSDAVIVASENLSSLTKFIESSGKPFLPFAPRCFRRAVY
jgi:starch synthase